MDIFAHALWAGAGLAALRQRLHLTPAAAAATVGLAVVPDLVHLLPIGVWVAAGDGTIANLKDYALALPDHGPLLPPWVEMASHHLHCVMHSALVAAAVTLLLWAVMQTFWLPLLGWWSHIVIDVFTHSADFYPSPVLYPITQRGFDGIAWNTPWFVVVNYAALGAVGIWLWGRRHD
jgi:hypothetical protein